MAKLLKKILGAAAVGTAAAGALYYWKKSKVDTDEFEDDFEDEDFDLDDDLKSVSDREYVSLNSAPKNEEKTEEVAEKGETAEEPAKEAAEAEETAEEPAEKEETAEKDTDKEEA